MSGPADPFDVDPVPGWHRCPCRGCPMRVSNALFACVNHWAVLPIDVQRQISRTAKLSPTAARRREAFAAARHAWGDDRP